MEKEMKDLLAKIYERANKRDCLLSEFPEWKNIELYAIEKYGHWNGLYIDGELQRGRLMHSLINWKYLNASNLPGDISKKVPFHCYAITPYDVLFTKQTLEWNDHTKKYTGIYAEAMRETSLRLTNPELLEQEQKQPQQSSTANPQNAGCMVFIIIMIVAAIGLII